MRDFGRWSLVVGFWFLALAVACASGGDDDDDPSISSGSDDDSGDDDDATDDDDGAAPTAEQCELIWAGCESDVPIDPTDAGCGEEPVWDPIEVEAWVNWDDCMNAALAADYAALDACGYGVGCDDEKHDLYDCQARYYESLGHCAGDYDWSHRFECVEEKRDAYWCSDL